jgi:hypothetical protein
MRGPRRVANARREAFDDAADVDIQVGDILKAASSCGRVAHTLVTKARTVATRTPRCDLPHISSQRFAGLAESWLAVPQKPLIDHTHPDPSSTH